MKKKVLLMGKSSSGKTSMRSIIFANYIARDTRRLGATIDVEHSHVRFLGDLVLNLWDCGGQEVFMENYFTSQKHNIFRNVAVLIYVFDVQSDQWDKDMEYYTSCLASLRENSRDAKIFCLVHKMDLVVGDDQRQIVFAEREDEIKRLSLPLSVTCFGTSIWDETLYKAWSSIVVSLIPNVSALQAHLETFRTIVDADEVGQRQTETEGRLRETVQDWQRLVKWRPMVTGYGVKTGVMWAVRLSLVDIRVDGN
eukprot:m.12232 g.12232  ORF g.12232 m.12232 type:complete len:253 (-) comp9912_c0_seq2:491-1249(-)